MFHNDVEILEGAFVITDAHYSKIRPELLLLIREIHSQKLQPTQLIFLGDIFDALFGGVKKTQRVNSEMIELLNDISRDIELIYLEGNHDFNLYEIFPYAKVFSYSQQPISCRFETKTLTLAHGDFDVSISYKLYTWFIRNSLVMFFLSMIDSIGNHFILEKLESFLEKKDDCKEFIGFKDFISKRKLSRYKSDYFIEGHFHQNSSFDFEKYRYINLAAFACNQRYFIVKSTNNKLDFYEEKFSKGE